MLNNEEEYRVFCRQEEVLFSSVYRLTLGSIQANIKIVLDTVTGRKVAGA
jgi:hypothetical protein